MFSAAETNDPLNSRVIIFSNYRGIVRDIMNALADIGHIIKATEFIGQSSGKTSKGQSQKIQQAVLKKFRDGGYNVIVATSIGEEGLDIMEVDLVICYDANVSPLRMIQRMGRTGRNHEGRVVVLACEGTELKAYLRKQGSCKTLDKHMRNGGRTSFNFHSSPRMIPHIYKPEVQYVELSIKQFVPRDKKVLDDLTIQPPIFEAKLNDAETDLLRKYFQPTENLWGPSLIAFPHFQAFPSRVHNVMHSFRSGMLIDTMQYLQGLSYIRDNKACFDEAVAVSDLSASCEIGEHRDRRMNELQTLYKSGNVNSQREVSDSHVPSLSPTKREEKHCFTNFLADNPSTHSYLFGSDFVSVDALGRVLLSVPLLPLKDACSKCTSASSGGLQSCFKQDACGVKEDSVVEYEIETKQVNYFGATQTVFKGNKMVHAEFSDSDSDSRQERSLNVDDKVSETPICSKKFSNGKTSEAVHVEKKTAYESGNCVGDVELSPRLTNLLKSGVVPESPTDNSGTQECKRKCEFLDDDLDSPSKGQTKVILNSSVRVKLDKVIDDSNASEVLPSSINIEVPSFAINGNNVSAINSAAFPVVEDVGTPPENPLASSCSEDWHFTSGDNSESVSKARKYKRLRKYGDLQTKHPLEKNESRIDKAELGRSSACTNRKHIRGEKKMTEDVRVFIEEQAEVSGELPLSEDDDDEPDNNSYDDSFIDDRINLTAGSTPTEDRNRDMMAIYRRSLLSQSPIVRLPIPLMDNTPDSSVSRDQITYSISSERIKHSPRTPQTGLESECTGWNSEVSRLNPERNPDSVLCNSGTRREDENNIESRKRKIDSYQVGPLPVQNLEHEFLCQSEPHVKHLPQPEWINRNNPTTVEFEDDEFYEGIDLDAVEEEAKRYLECKSQMSVQNQILNPEPAQNLGEPTFDLGI